MSPSALIQAVVVSDMSQCSTTIIIIIIIKCIYIAQNHVMQLMC